MDREFIARCIDELTALDSSPERRRKKKEEAGQVEEEVEEEAPAEAPAEEAEEADERDTSTMMID